MGAGRRAQAPSRGLGTPSAWPVRTKEDIWGMRPRARAGGGQLFQWLRDAMKTALSEAASKWNE